jgi:hypothetical protein
VKKIWLLSLIPAVFSIVLMSSLYFSLSFLPTKAGTEQISQRNNIHPRLRYELRDLPQSQVHILFVPSNGMYSIVPAVSDQVNTVEEFAQKYRNHKQSVSAIINAGFFDPVNQKTTSFITIAGQVVADPNNNPRLIDNPSLKSYLNQILNRSEFRRILCGNVMRYDITLHGERSPQGCRLIDAIGAGPQLLPKLGLAAEGFTDIKHQRDALSSDQLNARTVIGIKHDGTVVLVMVAQKPDDSNPSGMSLPMLADFLKSLGVEKAMNLDGGSSSSLYYEGKAFYGKLDSGNPVKRPVKSVLLVKMQ